MIKTIVQSSLRCRFLVIAIAAGIMAFGISRLQDMPANLYPEFSPPYVQVQTEALGRGLAGLCLACTLRSARGGGRSSLGL